MIKYERIPFTKNMLKGMYYNAMKVNKEYAHIRSIRLLTTKQEEMLTSPGSKQ